MHLQQAERHEKGARNAKQTNFSGFGKFAAGRNDRDCCGTEAAELLREERALHNKWPSKSKTRSNTGSKMPMETASLSRRRKTAARMLRDRKPTKASAWGRVMDRAKRRILRRMVPATVPTVGKPTVPKTVLGTRTDPGTKTVAESNEAARTTAALSPARVAPGAVEKVAEETDPKRNPSAIRLVRMIGEKEKGIDGGTGVAQCQAKN